MTELFEGVCKALDVARAVIEEVEAHRERGGLVRSGADGERSFWMRSEQGSDRVKGDKRPSNLI